MNKIELKYRPDYSGILMGIVFFTDLLIAEPYCLLTNRSFRNTPVDWIVITVLLVLAVYGLCKAFGSINKSITVTNIQTPG